MNQYIINAASELTLRGLIKLASPNPSSDAKGTYGQAYQKSLGMDEAAQGRVNLANRAKDVYTKDYSRDLGKINADYARQIASLRELQRNEIRERKSIYDQNAAMQQNAASAARYQKEKFAPMLQEAAKRRATEGVLTRQNLSTAGRSASLPPIDFDDIGAAFRQGGNNLLTFLGRR